MHPRRIVVKDYDSGACWDEDDEPVTRRAALGPPAPQVPRRLFTDVEAASYIGVSRSYVRALVANGDLPRVELPATDGRGVARMLRIDVRDLDAFVARMKG